MVLRPVALGRRLGRKEDKGAPWTTWHLQWKPSTRIIILTWQTWKWWTQRAHLGLGRQLTRGDFALGILPGIHSRSCIEKLEIKHFITEWFVVQKGLSIEMILCTFNWKSEVELKCRINSPSLFILRVCESKVCLDLFLDGHRHCLFWVWSGHWLGLKG